MKSCVLLILLILGTSMASDIFLGEKHQPGFIQIDDKNDLFYWLFFSRQNSDQAPLTIWLTGGPGCSSELAIFYENGPFKINQDLSLRLNQYSWNNQTNLLYVDQPVGTGYSKGKDYVTNEDEIASDFYKFLLNFMEKHPEFKGRPLYITGESYAGHYIPAISYYLFNQKNADIQLKGMAIGNGWVDPYLQYPAYATFSYHNKLVGKLAYYGMKVGYAACQKLISSGLWPVALEECNLVGLAALKNPVSPAFNVYDIRKKCDVPPLCYDFSLMDKFLARKDVIEKLGVQGRSWSSCNMYVHTLLLGDWMTNFQGKVKSLLENGVKTLVYSGDKDYICNWEGGDAWTQSLMWNGRTMFQSTPFQNWVINGKVYGQFRQSGALTFLKVHEAGHMVPMDQPQAAQTMLDTFLN